MNKIITIFLIAIVSAFSVSAQNKEVVSDTLVMGPLYANDIFYSMQDGEISSVERAGWELGFYTSAFSAGIIINEGNGVQLFHYPNDDTAGWSTFDTTGMMSWSSLSNSNEYWEDGAFNRGALNHPDYGWGVYNDITHNLTGDSLYLIAMPDVEGDVVYKKLWIFDSNDWSSSMNVYEWGDIVFTSSEWLFSAILGFILLVGVPFLALAYGGAVLLFPRFKVPYLGASFFGLWFIGLILAIMTAFSVGQEFSKEEKVSDIVMLSDQGLVADTIDLSVGDDPFGISVNRAYYANNDFMMKVDNRRIIVGNVEFDIHQSNDDQIRLEVKKSAQAESYEEAGIRADSIKYNFSMDSSSITFDPFFSYPQIHLLRDQEVRLSLKLPIGTVVFLDPSIKRIMDDIQNVTNMYDPKMVSHYWIMNSDGLTCLDCEEAVVQKEDGISIEVTGESLDLHIN